MQGRDRVIRSKILEEKFFENQLPTDTSTVLIKADEMRNFVEEWMRSGKPDLTIDNTLCKRLYQYIEYQNALREAKGRLAEDEFQRYIVEADDVVVDKCELVTFLKGGERLLAMEVFPYRYVDFPILQLIRVRDFKRLMSMLGNKFVSYAYLRRENLFVDITLYCADIGVKIISDADEWKYNLIFPSDRPK